MVNTKTNAKNKHEATVTWSQLPQKGQLALLTLARMSEPLTQTSLHSYMFYQLRSFDPSLPDPVISQQAGLLASAFTGAQCLTAMLWGRVADSERVGRKRVVLFSLFSTALSVIGFGFSRNFAMAMVFRVMGGLLNGNVGVMRTMVSEIVKEKKYLSRAFLLMPMTFNIGVIIGPIIGGVLADPVGAYPAIFGPGSRIGGKDGVWWMTHWPYLLPNIVSAAFLLAGSLAIFLGLEETHHARQDKSDYGRRLGQWLLSKIRGRPNPFYKYEALTDNEDIEGHSASVELVGTPTTPTAPENHLTSDISPPSTPSIRRKTPLPFRAIFTRNVTLTLIAHAFLASHVGTFNNLWFVFLSADRHPASVPQSPPIHFTGGLALPPARIGLALAILGVIGITLQLTLYPTVNSRFGTVQCYKNCLIAFPVAYTLTPYLAIVPSSTAPPAPVSGPWIWLSLGAVLFIQVLGRTFALPATQILVNNCCPDPSVLGTVHGLGQSVSSAVRTVGPVVFAWLFGKGLEIGVVGLAWWGLGVLAILGAVAGRFVKDGRGEEEAKEEERMNPP